MRGLLDCPASRSKTSREANDVVRAAERVLADAAEGDAKGASLPADAAVEVLNFGFSYGAFRALTGVSFEVRSGEIFALCGPRGCGAQTMLSAIGGTLPGAGEWGSEGDILIANASVAGSPDRARKLAATAFAQGLPEEQSVYNALARPLRLLGVHADAALHDAIDAVLAVMDVRDRFVHRLDERVCSLPSVDQRLIRLAQALLRGPRALLVEEPTCGLSLADGLLVQGAAKRIAQERGIAVIVETCDEREVVRLADRAAFFLDGALVAVGTPVELASPRADYRARAYFEGRMR